MQAKAESATLLSSCSLSKISNMCLEFHLWQLVEVIQENVTDYHEEKSYGFPESAREWINANLGGEDLHCSAVQPILELYGCTSMTSEAKTYECTEDWWEAW